MKRKLSLLGILFLCLIVLIFLSTKTTSFRNNINSEIKWTRNQIINDYRNGKIDPEFQKYFDRDPERTVPNQKDIVVSPADGQVISIFKDSSGYTIIIHLSLFDVHVQRIPISGTVVNIQKLGSKYFSGRDPKYLDGVQTVTTLKTTIGDVKIKQITSLFTKRIQTYPKIGDKVKIGDRLGRILLGSTVEIILPQNVSILVKKNDKVYGAETIIAKYK